MQKTALVFAFAVFMIFAEFVEAKLFEAESFFLDNGMQVVLIENHKAPLIKQMVWYRNGASDDRQTKGGTAHLLEHLMFRGTKHFAEGRLDEIFEKHGVQSNAFTSNDYTSYHQFADISKLEAMMLLEADRMHNLVISGKNFAKERDIVYQERRQQIESSPVYSFMEKLREKLWGKHPYSRPVIGSTDEIKSLEKQDVMDYYERFYTPQNAVLILAGDLDLPTAKKLAEKYYGKLKSRKNFIPAEKYEHTPQKTKQTFIYKDKKVKNLRIVMMFVVPSYNLNPKEAMELEILAEYLGADKISPVYKELVEERGILTGLSVSNGFSARGYDLFYVVAYPKDGTNTQVAAKQLEQSIRKSIEKMTDENTDAAKKRILANLVFIADNPSDAAYIAGEMISGGMSLKDVNNYDKNILNVETEDIKSMALKMLDKNPQILGILLPDENHLSSDKEGKDEK